MVFMSCDSALRTNQKRCFGSRYRRTRWCLCQVTVPWGPIRNIVLGHVTVIALRTNQKRCFKSRDCPEDQSEMLF